MMRQLINVGWGVAVGATITTFILAVGSTMPDQTLTLAIAAMIFGGIVLIGMAVWEIESRAFKRGQLDAEEQLRKAKEVMLP